MKHLVALCIAIGFVLASSAQAQEVIVLDDDGNTASAAETTVVVDENADTPSDEPMTSEREEPTSYEQDSMGDEDYAPTFSETRYISSPVMLDDANPVPADVMNFRLFWGYMTESNRASRDTDDDTWMQTQMFWGVFENFEVSLDLPINFGDGGDTRDNTDGNADLSVGFLYRFWEEDDVMPAFAFSSKLRTPTGDRSNGVDAEFRGILTKTLVGDLRGHLNAFCETVNGNNDPQERDFQWGLIVGTDMPLTDAKDLWLILDYMHRNSEHYANSNTNMCEAAVEWQLHEVHSVHFSTQVGLDDNGDTPNWGAMVGYTFEIPLQ